MYTRPLDPDPFIITGLRVETWMKAAVTCCLVKRITCNVCRHALEMDVCSYAPAPFGMMQTSLDTDPHIGYLCNIRPGVLRRASAPG
jgi:hypothetical protein